MRHEIEACFSNSNNKVSKNEKINFEIIKTKRYDYVINPLKYLVFKWLNTSNIYWNSHFFFLRILLTIKNRDTNIV